MNTNQKPIKYDRNSEMSVLYKLVNPSTPMEEIEIILASLNEEHFYLPYTRELFLFIKERHSQGKSFSFINLDGIVPDNLHDLLCDVMSDIYFMPNISFAIDSLEKHRKIRPLLNHLFISLTKISEQKDIDLCNDEILSLMQSLENNAPLSREDYMCTYEDLIEECLSEGFEETQPIQTELKDWPPFPPSSMITIAGRSGAGKTFLGIYLLEKLLMAQPGTVALYFNIEMEKQTMFARHANLVEPVKGSIVDALKKGLASKMLQRNVILVNKSGITIEEIESITKAISLKNKISVVVVDYVGLVKSRKKYESHYLMLDAIAERLSGLALKHSCIVLALQQVSRKPAERAKNDRVPYPTDAAGTQGFERSSHWWLGIDRPAIDEPENIALDGIFVIKNRKQRTDAGYFTIYHEFKDGRFLEICQRTADERFKSLSNPLSSFSKSSNYPNKHYDCPENF